MSNEVKIIERLTALKNQIETHTEFTIKQVEAVQLAVNDIKDDVKDIKKEVKLTNSRVNHIEDKQKNCPISVIGDDLNEYKKKMQPLYIIATNWKMVFGIAVIIAFLIKVFDILGSWLANQANIPQ